MENLTYGDLTIIQIALVALVKGVDEDSELGRQLCECIGKVDLFMLNIRSSEDKKQA